MTIICLGSSVGQRVVVGPSVLIRRNPPQRASLGELPLPSGNILDFNRENQELNLAFPQKDSYPEVGITSTQSAPSLNPEKASYTVRGLHIEIPCCSNGTSSTEQNKGFSSSQPQLSSESFPATIEAGQILSSLQ